MKPAANRSVAGVRRKELMSAQDASRVRIDDEARTVGGVQQDGVGRLRSDSVDRKEPTANGFQIAGQKVIEPTGVVGPESIDEGFDPPCLYAVGAGRAHQFTQRIDIDVPQRRPIEQSVAAQSQDGPLHTPPRRVLRENRANHHLKGRFRRPPILRPERSEQTVVDGSDCLPPTQRDGHFPPPARIGRSS